MVVGPDRYYTVDEWRALERQGHDVRYEYYDGRIVAMLGGNLAHSAVALNLINLVRQGLRGSSCRVYNSDAAVRVSGRVYVYPDATITCSPLDQPAPDRTEITTPRVIFEVLSDSTEIRDRTMKFQHYRSCQSIQEYVLIASKYQTIERYTRTTDGHAWLYEAFGPGEMVKLVVGFALSVDEIYQDTGVPAITTKQMINDVDGEHPDAFA